MKNLHFGVQIQILRTDVNYPSGKLLQIKPLTAVKYDHRAVEEMPVHANVRKGLEFDSGPHRVYLETFSKFPKSKLLQNLLGEEWVYGCMGVWVYGCMDVYPPILIEK
ncbi:predicted protein [Sclerotinia sclerotiorum 1980 UF-70]|uniref:Uncharacterized protein n=1 Tax=Sclerotinia sclerotiorum (strain ATCC 18683 / 1980 / Ss-1) TaxID=665079 RepID=A7EKX0_SCLS1|nr:predicted protein [Sclerotinia sclerotiorum 1980 UF-70]EDO03486.1 predicted protein [Sclerotinia sclerotiorum 1980 UF-70]